MSDEWRELTIAEVALWRGGLTPSKTRSDYWHGGRIPWISSKEVVGGTLAGTEHSVSESALRDTALRLIPSGSVAVVVRSGILIHTFPVAYVPFATTVNQDVKIGTPTQEINGRFLSYLLQSQSNEILAKYRKTGTTVQSINFPALLQHKVMLPPLAVQRRIVDVVGAVDAHISNLNREASTVWHCYSDALGHSLTGDLVQLGDLMQLDLDVRRVRDSDEFRILGVLNRGGGLIDKGVVRGSDTGYASLNRVSAGQLVMRKLTAWEGPISVVPDEFDGYYASAEFPTFSIDETRLLPEFMGHVCRAPALWQQMKERVTGTVQRRKRLKPEQLLEVAMRVPALAEQCAFAEALTSLQRAAQHLEKEAGALAVLRRQVLESLLSREVEVPESYDVLLDAGVA